MSMPSEAVRAYLYRVLVALGPILVLHGFVTDVEVTLYLAALAEVLGVGLAALNTSTAKVEKGEVS